MGAKFKAEGLKPGFPDLSLHVARKGCHSLHIEMKVGRNTLTPEQIEWIIKLTDAGNMAVACWGQDEARKVIMEYLS